MSLWIDTWKNFYEYMNIKRFYKIAKGYVYDINSVLATNFMKNINWVLSNIINEMLGLLKVHVLDCCLVLNYIHWYCNNVKGLNIQMVLSLSKIKNVSKFIFLFAIKDYSEKWWLFFFNNVGFLITFKNNSMKYKINLQRW